APGAPVDLKGARVTAPVALKDDGGPAADELVTGTVKMAVHVSGDRRSLRVWDPAGPLARGFKGFTRFLYSDLKDDGTTVLDFNQAYNPPCAFNPFTTCPIPLPENRLPVKVLAG